MNKIEIQGLLPNVFIGMESTPQIRESRIWDVPSFFFLKGCRICLQAESGGGKSSLLSFIFGNRRDYKGEILFDGTNIQKLDVNEWCDIRKKNISLLPQEMRLFPELTVMENINLKNDLTTYKSKEEITRMLELLGIPEKANSPVGKLSIGQQQRVAIIRTLCQPFDFIFLDEPVSHLDQTNNRIVAELVDKEASLNGAGIITTSVGNHLLLENAEFIRL